MTAFLTLSYNFCFSRLETSIQSNLIVLGSQFQTHNFPLFFVSIIITVNHGEPDRRRRLRVPFRLRQPLLLGGPRRSSPAGAEQPPHLPLRPLRRANLRHLLHHPSLLQPLQVNYNFHSSSAPPPTPSVHIRQDYFLFCYKKNISCIVNNTN